MELERGADYGWPECYYDLTQQKLVLAPEYGGDGGKAVGPCAQKRAPVAVFPAHWAPNDLLFYYGHQFPTAYRGGAFIVFHGSWNRAPSPQGGYNVVFQPFIDGKPTGKYLVFADGFAGAVKEPGRAAHRPSGLAVGPDGALYITDDKHGRIWRVTYRGPTTAGIEAAPSPSFRASNSVPRGCRSAGRHPSGGWLAGERLHAAPLRCHGGTGCARRPSLPRPTGRCNVCRVPRIGRQGNAAGARPHEWQVVVGRWQPAIPHPDNYRWSTEPEGVQGRDASDRWWAAFSC